MGQKALLCLCVILALVPMISSKPLENMELHNEDGRTVLRANFSDGTKDEVIESAMTIMLEIYAGLGKRIDEIMIYVGGRIYEKETARQTTTVAPATEGFQANAVVGTTSQTTAKMTTTTVVLQQTTPTTRGDPAEKTDSEATGLRSGGKSAIHNKSTSCIVIPLVAGLKMLQLFM